MNDLTQPSSSIQVSAWHCGWIVWLAAAAPVLLCLLGQCSLADDSKPRITLKGHSEKVTSLTFSPDGKTLASASYDGTIRLWDVARGEAKATLKMPFGFPVEGLAFSPDGK